MEWILLLLIVYTVLLAVNGAFHEDDKDLYDVMAGAISSGICVMIVFVVWLIVRLLV